VTKSGDIAGPRVLEHIVDVVLYMEVGILLQLSLFEQSVKLICVYHYTFYYLACFLEFIFLLYLLLLEAS